MLVENTAQQVGTIPTVEQYTFMRLGTSGITPGLAFCEFTSDVRLPDEIMESREMRDMWREATSLCMMINDLYSMKKEVKSGALQNMIPVMINASPSSSLWPKDVQRPQRAAASIADATAATAISSARSRCGVSRGRK